MTEDSKRHKVVGFLKTLGKTIINPEVPAKATVDDATTTFNNLSLGNTPAFPQPQTGTLVPNDPSDFIGGFSPHVPSNHVSHTPPPPPPKRPSSTSYTIQMAMSNQPTSNTMQMAQQMVNEDKDPYTPVYNLLGVPNSHSRPVSTSNLPSQVHSFPTGTSATPPRVDTKPAHRRANSTPPASPTKDKETDKVKKKKSTGSGDAVQCSGVTKAGKRCTRQIKIASCDDDDDEDKERFCHQHTKELLGPTGFYARKNGIWIDFADWIPDYLEPATKVALRVEMERAKSSSDVPGYIYTFEIRPNAEDDNKDDVIQLKVGRAVNLVKRIDQWGKQCGSKEQVLRGWYPGSVDPDADDDSGGVSLMKGRVIAGPKGPWCHRLERLIHLELGDLARNRVYLQPNWPASAQVSDTSSNSTKTVPAATVCPDCGQMHKEIFTFARVKKGKYRGKEWEKIAKPVIEKWGAFVEAYV